MREAVLQKKGGMFVDVGRKLTNINHGEMIRVKYVKPREYKNETEAQRTKQQNKCMWDWLTALAEKMSDAGLDMRQVITVPIKPTKENVMAEMGRPVLEALYPDKVDPVTGYVSTADLSTKEIQVFYEVMNRATSEKLGIGLHWPSIDTGGRT